MPRRLAVPALSDEQIRLEPLSRALAPAFGWVLGGDADLARFTLLPSAPDGGFLERWLGRYELGWEDSSCAGFAAFGDDPDEALAFAALVQLDLERLQGEIGYLVAPAARGRGVASRAVALLTRWGLEELGLERIELRIDPANTGSNRVAERNGYVLEGVHRSMYFKEGLRSDVGVWARLRRDGIS